MLTGVIPLSSLNFTCLARRRVGFRDGRVHRIGHFVGVHDYSPVDMPRRAPGRLDQRRSRPQEPFLVRIQDRHQRYLRQVKPLPQKVDTHYHIEHAQAQVSQDSDALQRLHLGMQVVDLDPHFHQVVRQVLGHALGQAW